MLPAIRLEVARFEEVVAQWPAFAPGVEAAACAALREVVATVSRQCGFVQVRAHTPIKTPQASAVLLSVAVSPLSSLFQTARDFEGKFDESQVFLLIS
jgi:hypothetical protein